MKKYINGQFIEMTPEEITIVRVEQETYKKSIEYKLKQVQELKQMLADTDYISCKIADGAATREQYAEQLSQRQYWRDEINRLSNGQST